MVFATYCLELVLGSMSGWLGCVWGLLLVDFRFSVRLVWACVFLIVLRFRFGCFRFPLGFPLRFTLACAIVLIWGWLGVCLVSI